MLDLRAAVVQLRSTPDPRHSIGRALAVTEAALDAGAQLVALPENYAGIAAAGDPAPHRASAETLAEDPAVAPFLALSAGRGATILLGGLAIVHEARRSHNALLLLTQGRIGARYDKIHAFEATLPDGSVVSELATTTPGARPVVAALEAVRIGLSICYDLRFPELYRALVDAGAELLVAPSAFTYPTGAAHWSLLVRTRALESQCFMLAPAQWGHHAAGRQSWGHAMIVDPWGTVLAQVPDGEGFATAQLHGARLEDVRTALPALAHRRLPPETSAQVVTLTEGTRTR